MNALLRCAVSLALVTCVVACTPSEAVAPAALPSVGVHTMTTEVAELRVALPGRAVAAREAEIRPQVDGIIARRLFEEGSWVREGQPLYQLDDARLRANRDDAQARLSHAHATCSSARQEARRLAELATLQLVSQQDKERASAAHERAEAEIKMASASLQTARVDLSRARISAPISGRVGRSAVTEGALVSAHQPEALVTVHAVDPMHIDLAQSAAEWLQLRREIAAGRLDDNRELAVEITLEDGTVYPQAGSLQFSEAAVDPATGTYGLRVRVPNPDGVLLPGMYVTASLGAGVRQDALLVPMKAVARDTTGKTQVTVVDERGVVQIRPVTLGGAVGERWLVEKGLARGERVVVEGLHKLRAGDRVQPVEAQAVQATAAVAQARPAPAREG